MSFAEATLTPRHLGAILTGLCKKNFYDNAISLNDLAVFYADSGLSEEGVLQHSGLLEQLLRKAAHENMTPENMESAATEFQLQPALVETLSRFWRTERSKVHEAVLKKSTWNSHLKQLSWRIDVKTASKDVPDLNEPTAVFELASTAGHIDETGQAGSTMRFEMSRDQLGSVLDAFKEIDTKIAEFKA